MKYWKNQTAKKKYLNELLSGDESNARAYKMTASYELGDFINHSKFGLGFIHNVISNSKIEVYFDHSEKTLVQNWQ